MIEMAIFWAAAGQAQVASAPAGEVRAAADPAILENAYNAFVAVEESPSLREIVTPAIVTRIGHERAIVGARGAGPIS